VQDALAGRKRGSLWWTPRLEAKSCTTRSLTKRRSLTKSWTKSAAVDGLLDLLRGADASSFLAL